MNEIETKIYENVVDTLGEGAKVIPFLKKVVSSKVDDSMLLEYSPIINKMNMFRKEIIDYLCELADEEKFDTIFDFLASEGKEYEVYNNNHFFKALNEIALKRVARTIIKENKK